MSTKHNYNSWLVDLIPFGLTKNDDIKVKLCAKGIDVFDFTLGDPKEPTPDFIRKALVDHIPKTSQYPANIGLATLRKSCADWLKRRFDVDVDTQSEVISSNGSKEAIFHIPQVLFNASSEKRTVVYPQPGYPAYRSGTVLAGGECYEEILDPGKNYVFDPSDIPKHLLSKISAVWVCYPHNPTGALISEIQMEKIYEWALEHDITLLCDECYVDMYFENTHPPITFLKIGQKNKFKNMLCFFSLSKRSGMTGYRSGFVAGDSEKISLFAKYRLNVGLGTPEFIQHAAIAAWNDDNHVLERNKIFFEKRSLVEKFFQKNNLVYTASNATFYIWGKIPACYSSGLEFTNTLSEQTGIMTTPGSAFGSSCASYFRISLVPTVEDIKLCLNIWQQKIDQGHFKI